MYILTLVQLVAYLANNETKANGYSSDGTQRELSNEYQYDRVWKTFKIFCVFAPLTKVASASKGIKGCQPGCGERPINGCVYMKDVMGEHDLDTCRCLQI